MKTTINGRSIAYDDSGSGVPLLLFHAFPFNRSMYREQAEGLGDVARVIAFDAPGIGGSEPGALSIDGIADIGLALLDGLGIERAAVGGVSMGGYATLSFARRHADRLRGVLLANTRAGADTPQALEGRRAMIQAVERDGPAAVIASMFPKLTAASTAERNPALLERVREIIESAPPDTIIGLIRAMMERPDSTPMLGSVSVPTLVVTSDQDELTPAAETRTWAPLIPDARLVEIPGAGHLANMEAPDQVNAAIRDWLRGL